MFGGLGGLSGATLTAGPPKTDDELRKHLIDNKFDYLKDGINKKGEVSFN